jgi:hypothetical protein
MSLATEALLGLDRTVRMKWAQLETEEINTISWRLIDLSLTPASTRPPVSSISCIPKEQLDAIYIVLSLN